jgi:hypothetical protein
MSNSNWFSGLAIAAGVLLASTGVSHADDTSACGLPESGDCLEDNGTAGCSDETCCLEVCAIDLFCCKEVWDTTCAELAIELCAGGGGGNCGDPSAGDCYEANGTPGCDDLTCCSNVCAADPYCCDTAWDFICADAAQIICYDGPTPENDECLDSIDLGTGDSVTPIQTLGATTSGPDLPAECESFGSVTIYNDIWFTWTATSDEIATFATCNDVSFDTRLAAWTGDCENLEFVACNDDGLGCAGYSSFMVVPVTAGTTYYIQLGGFAANAAGDGNLTICEGEACLAGCILNCEKTDVPENELCGEDLNGGCNDPTGGNASQLIEVGDTVCGSLWASGGTRDTDWFDFTIAERSRLTWSVEANVPLVLFFLSSECPPAIQIGNAYDACPAVHTACLDAGTYRVFVAANGFDGVPCGSGAVNTYRATLTAEPAFVEGDTCDEAIVIGDFEGDVEFSTDCASTDGADLPTECESFGSSTIYNDIYMSWTVPSDGDWFFSTCNQATFDTRLAAYASCGGALLGCNDDDLNCTGYTSLLALSGLTAGEEVIIQVGAWGNGVSGSGILTIGTGGGGPEPPSNDDCADAIAITDGLTGISTIGASTDGPTLPEECAKFGNPEIFNDVWFTYDATVDGFVTASFCPALDATFDTKMAVYANGCEGGDPIACNDDTCGLSSEVSFGTVCGETYLIRIGSYSSAGQGIATLDISGDGESCGGGGGCPADLNDDGIVDGADFGLLLVAWGECSGCAADLNDDGLVDGADVGLLLVAWGFCP